MPKAPKEYKFTYLDLQKLSGLNQNAVEQHKSRGNFDPESLRSVVVWLASNGTKELKLEMMEAMISHGYPKTRGARAK